MRQNVYIAEVVKIDLQREQCGEYHNIKRRARTAKLDLVLDFGATVIGDERVNRGAIEVFLADCTSIFHSSDEPYGADNQ